MTRTRIDNDDGDCDHLEYSDAGLLSEDELSLLRNLCENLVKPLSPLTRPTIDRCLSKGIRTEWKHYGSIHTAASCHLQGNDICAAGS